jgi:hypothetical protein
MRLKWEAAKARSSFFGPERPTLPAALGGGSTSLSGDLAGDYGWDPLGLWASADTTLRTWLREAEVLHARWAMLGIVGALVPEVLALTGADLGEPVWWKVGSFFLDISPSFVPTISPDQPARANSCSQSGKLCAKCQACDVLFCGWWRCHEK